MTDLDRLRQRFDTLAAQTNDEWELFTPIIESVTYPKHDFLIQEGQLETYIYFIA
ncbi:hypothetical protein [Spirosoma sp. KNUC1025]|uniref:hypothetical protein n=1 Tax=Spirosoma sp. KNUC1025 TaxID=2894082 RepID=UPI00386A3F24|nr:hypothetical protein LN737_13510 [Spirosoma sp. KNUC1025]